MTRRMLTEPNTALAGAILGISFARFRPSMAIFSAARRSSCPFGRWDVLSMIRYGARKGCGKQAVRKNRKARFFLTARCQRIGPRATAGSRLKSASACCFTFFICPLDTALAPSILLLCCLAIYLFSPYYVKNGRLGDLSDSAFQV